MRQELIFMRWQPDERIIAGGRFERVKLTYPDRCSKCHFAERAHTDDSSIVAHGEIYPQDHLSGAMWPDSPLGINAYASWIGPCKRFRPILPHQIWTLYHYTDELTRPHLPYVATHNVNAFLEAYVHDWNDDPDGYLQYHTRILDRSVWILLEYDE